MELKIKNFDFSYGATKVLQNINFNFTDGITCLLGENGSGKSTLIKSICGLLKKPSSIFYNNSLINKKFLQKYVSYLPQIVECKSNLSVLEVVLLGKIFSLGIKISKSQKEEAMSALRQLKVDHLCSLPINNLSGGQKQIVLLAQALLKKPRVLLLDEPCSYLDIYNQIQLMEILRSLSNVIIIIAMHDISLSLQYSKKLIILKEGKVYFGDSPDYLKNIHIKQIYKVNSTIFKKERKKCILYKNLI